MIELFKQAKYKIDKVKIPENRRLIGNKWVFKIKRDGTYRARLVALGYSQIHQTDRNPSPVEKTKNKREVELNRSANHSPRCFQLDIAF